MNGHISNTRFWIKPQTVKQTYCTLCRHEFLTCSQQGIRSHLLAHIRHGEMERSSLRATLEQIVGNTQKVKV